MEPMSNLRSPLIWEAAKHAPESPLLVFSTAEAFAESLDDDPNLWSTAVRQGAEAARRLRLKRKRDEDGTASGTDDPVPKPVALVAVEAGEKARGQAEVRGIASAGFLQELLRRRTGMDAFRVHALPGSASKAEESVAEQCTCEDLLGPIGLLLMTPTLAPSILEEIARRGGQNGLQHGCVVVLLEVPTEGLIVKQPDGSAHAVLRLEQDENNKQILSLERWRVLMASVRKQVGGHFLGLGMPSTGASVFYPDGWVEAVQTPMVKLSAEAELGERTVTFDIFGIDDNACKLPRGFAPCESPLTVAANWIAEGGVLAFTGAGISKESGVPTYRDGNGLWKRYDAMEVSSIGGLVGEPAKVWQFEREFNELLMASKGPNAGHRALAELEAMGCVDMVVTQNVDGFHQAAGGKEVLELHGSEVHAVCLNKDCGKRTEMRRIFDEAEENEIWSPTAQGWGVRWPESSTDTALQKAVREQLAALELKCTKRGDSSDSDSDGSSCSGDSSSSSSSCSSSAASAANATNGAGTADAGTKKRKRKARKKLPSRACIPKALSEEEAAQGPPVGRVPICPECRKGVLKPDGIFFGESLVKRVLVRSIRASAKAKVALMVGTSCQVDPAAKLPKLAKSKNKAKIVEVNIGQTRLSPSADLRLHGAAGEVLPKLLQLVASHPRTAELRRQRAEKEARLAVLQQRIAERLGSAQQEGKSATEEAGPVQEGGVSSASAEKQESPAPEKSGE